MKYTICSLIVFFAATSASLAEIKSCNNSGNCKGDFVYLIDHNESGVVVGIYPDQSLSIDSGRIAPAFGDIVKKDASSEQYCKRVGDTGICYATQQEAIDYCASQNQHLPSIRELAQLSASLGAKGITEEATDGSYLVEAKNPDNTVDKFYFDSTGYQAPEGELGENWFWSSSVVIFDPGFAFYFNGYHGWVDNYDYHLHVKAFRCVAGR